MIFVPQGFAHGIMTLTDDTEAFYLVNAFYAPEQERGLRFDDPRFGIEWPRHPVKFRPRTAAGLTSTRNSMASNPCEG